MEIPGARLGSLILKGRKPGGSPGQVPPVLPIQTLGSLNAPLGHLLSLKTESNLYHKNVPRRQYNNRPQVTGRKTIMSKNLIDLCGCRLVLSMKKAQKEAWKSPGKFKILTISPHGSAKGKVGEKRHRFKRKEIA